MALVDKLIYPIGMLGPVLLAPQAVKIYVEQDASSISLLAWTLGLIHVIIWLWYGIEHQKKPLIVYNILWMFLYTAIISGKLVFG